MAAGSHHRKIAILLRAHPCESRALFSTRQKPSHEQKVVSRQPVEMHMFEYERVVVIEGNDQVDDIPAAGGEIYKK
jgi:hypothetical protein